MRRRAWLVIAALVAVVRSEASAQPTPTGEVTIAWHVTIAPTWFDPSTAPPQITPFGMLYALHDALVRPLPGQKTAPSLAESVIRAGGPAGGVVLLRRLSTGSANAAVLPVPVWAPPSTSAPDSTSGMAWAWMGVGVV